MITMLRSLFGHHEHEPHDPEDVSTTFLFSSPSFLAGVGSTVTLWTNIGHYNFSADGEEADQRATYADWRMTGQDIRVGLYRAAVAAECEPAEK
ncbi:MAG TPA: hypothetical protein VMA36_06005 [Candidatus Limnocylindria bacterium]|nr:hypothetical protein [Candidatus Limnocylindria bacterium]